MGKFVRASARGVAVSAPLLAIVLLAGALPAAAQVHRPDADRADAAPADPAAPAAKLARPRIAPPAAWIDDAKVPPPPPAAEGSATINLLSDTQARLTDAGDDYYRKSVFRIADAKGLDSGPLQVTWDPSLETLTLHRYRILRDGKPIDLLGDGSAVSVVQRETQMENATLNGELTASIQPRDLRVGDTVELSYTITRHDPVQAGFSEFASGPADGVSFGRYRLRVVWPDGKPMHWRALPGVVQPKQTHTSAGNELVSDLVNVTTPLPPASAPPRFQQVNFIEASQFADWRTVSRTFAPLYLKAATLAPASPVRAEAQRIAAATADPAERAARALQLVQQQVRYLYLGMDDGGYVPAPADLTWSRRFGDCKGKTVLLVALLHELGIEARPVLVHTDRGDTLADTLPAMGRFNHAIVEARIGGRSYWLDGTELGATTLARLVTPDYRLGLPVTVEGSGLVPLVPAPLDAPQRVSSLWFDATQGLDVPATVRGEIRYHGAAAVAQRVRYSGLSQVDRTRALRERWRKSYAFVSPETVETREDAASGDFILAMHGTARMDWFRNSGTRWFEMDGSTLGWKFDINREGMIQVDAPFAFDFPDWSIDREEVRLPDGGKGFQLQGDEVDRTVGELYRLQRTAAIKDGVVSMEAQTRSLKGELPAAAAPKVRDELAELAKDAVYVRVPESYRATDGDMAALKDDKPALAKALAQRAAVAFDEGKRDAALAQVDEALALDPELATGHAIRALALAAKQDPGALDEAARALALDKGLWIAWRAKGMALLVRKDNRNAIPAFDRSLELHPGDSAVLSGRAAAHALLGHAKEGLADVDAALEIDPKLPLHVLRAGLLVALGRTDEGLSEIDKAVEAAPADRQARSTRAQLRMQAGRRTEALADADYLVAHHPTVDDYLLHGSLLPEGETARRQADLDMALKLDPRSTRALFVRAGVMADAHRFAEAHADLAAVRRIDPANHDVGVAEAQVFEREGRVPDAIAALDAAVRERPGDALVLNNRCWMKATRNVQAETALADCEAALKIAPGAPGLLDSRAFVRLRQGDLDGAIADYDAALKAAPRMAPSLYGRGIARARKGDRASAQADLALARSIDAGIDKRFADYAMVPPEGLAAAH